MSPIILAMRPSVQKRAHWKTQTLSSPMSHIMTTRPDELRLPLALHRTLSLVKNPAFAHFQGEWVSWPKR